MDGPLASGPPFHLPSETKIRAQRVAGATVLVIDDDPGVRMALSSQLRRNGFDPVTVARGREATDLLKTSRIDLCILDLQLPDMDGTEVLAAIKVVDPQMPVIMLSGSGTIAVATRCMKLGAHEFLTKPYELAELMHHLEGGLEKRRLRGTLAGYEASTKLLGVRGHGDVTHQAIEIATILLDANAVAIIPAAIFPNVQLEQHGQVPESLLHELGARMLEARRALHFRDLGAEGFRPSNFGSALSYPLSVCDQMVASLAVFRKADAPSFARAELSDGQVLADQLSLAMENAELFRRIETAEREARIGEERLRAVLDASHEAVLTTNTSGVIRDWSRAAERVYGFAADEALGRDAADLLVPERGREAHGLMLLEAQKASGPIAWPGSETVGRRKSGEEFPSEVSMTPLVLRDEILFCVFVRDLTASRRLEMELRHAQKLEAVGRLASGIAHEINTPIQFIGDSTEYIREAFDGMRRLLEAYRANVDPSALSVMAEAEEACDLAYLLEQVPKAITRTADGVSRVATIVRAMKSFAHQGHTEKAAADLNKALRDTLIVAHSEIKYVADVELDLNELPPVVCHAGDLNQVFLNLLVNAAHAIESAIQKGAPRGMISVRSRCETGWVFIEIADTGCGIPHEIRTRVFDPFFTTKEIGRGTGQGLALARAIVRDKHGGVLSFESQEGQGTTFRVQLPVDGGLGEIIGVSS